MPGFGRALTAMLLFAAPLAAQATAKAASADPLALLRVLEGRWVGETSGKPGRGTTVREYAFVLAGHFLSQRDSSVYETGAGKPRLVHEDRGMLDYDAATQRVVWRQFHSEGYVNEYVLERVSAGGDTLEFATTRIENLPGFRARKEYRVLSRDEIEERFWLAPPGQDFFLYTVSDLKRAR